MSSQDTPHGEHAHLSTSTPFISSSLEEVKAYYEARFTEVCQTETDIFHKAAKLLVKYGRPVFYRHSGSIHAQRQYLSTGYRAVGPIRHPVADDRSVIVVPAIRVSIGADYLPTAQAKDIPYADIRKVQNRKADLDEVTSRLQQAIGGVSLQGFLLATRCADIDDRPTDSLWTGITQEVDAPVGFFQEFRHYVKYGGDLDWFPYADVKKSLLDAPLAMWAMPLPELHELGVQSGNVPLIKQIRSSMPYDQPAHYAEVAQRELLSFVGRIPARLAAERLMTRSEEIGRPVVRLTANINSPIPSYGDYISSGIATAG